MIREMVVLYVVSCQLSLVAVIDVQTTDYRIGGLLGGEGWDLGISRIRD